MNSRIIVGGILCFLSQIASTVSLKCNGKCKCYNQGLDCSGAGFDEVIFDQKTFIGTIKTIDLRRNNIKHLPAYNSTFMNYEVAKINFDSNNIESIWTDMLGRTFPMLKSISFLHNKIKTVQKRAFFFLTELELLDLGDNQITEIESGAFLSQNKLLKLYLERNHLKILEPAAFEGLEKLKILKINKNNLQLLDSELFTHFSNLEELYAGSNSIKYLQPFDMKWPTKLRKVDLSNNSLRYIPNFPSFKKTMADTVLNHSWLFDVRNNDINCECVISDIQKYKSKEILNVICGFKTDCKFELQNLIEISTCNEKTGLRFVTKLQDQPTCRMPELQLKANPSHEHLTKLQCEAQGIPIPEIKLKSKDGMMIQTAEYKGNTETVYINTNNHPVSDVICVATNSLGSVESSQWFVTAMDGKNVTSYEGCIKTTQEHLSSEIRKFAFAYFVFSLCVLFDVIIGTFFVWTTHTHIY